MKMTFQLVKIILIYQLFQLVLVGCGKSPGNSAQNNAPITIVPSPVQSTVEEVSEGSTQCETINNESKIIEIDSLTAQVALLLKDVPDEPIIDVALFDSMRILIPHTRICTSNTNAVLISAARQTHGATLLLRERNSRKLFSISSIRLDVGKRMQFGTVRGTGGGFIHGHLLNFANTNVHGEIEELGWPIAIGADGEWQSGVLPAGFWSVKISDSQGNQAQFKEVKLVSEQVQIPKFSLPSKTSQLSPLWSGNLKESTASYLISSALDPAEMRIALEPSFTNVFWKPFHQVVTITVPSSGRHQVFAQVRSANGSVSEIFAHELNAQVLELTGNVDAVLITPILNMFEFSKSNMPMKGFITTTPPAGAIEHSVTIDIEDLPRNWVPVGTPLEFSLPVSHDSCGSHNVYVRFRSADAKESPSLTRIQNVRCWDRSLPVSPLEARYGHSAINISTAEWYDALLIWGGQNESRLFNDGAILRKQQSGVWVWEILPPSPLSPRTRPFVIAGIDHVLIYGGEDLAGNQLGGWALYNVMTKTWKSVDDFPIEERAIQPPALKYPAVGYVYDAHPWWVDYYGAFIIVGGERVDEPGEAQVSDEVYYLFEQKDMEIESGWTMETAWEPVSRATYSSGKGRVDNYFYVHSGVTNPSGTPTTSWPDNSSDNLELSGNLQVFGFYTDDKGNEEGSDDELVFINHLYRSRDSRTGALHGQPFFLNRLDKVNSADQDMQKVVPNFDFVNDQIESQLMCVYGATKYTDEFPDVCGSYLVGQTQTLSAFCRRLVDSFFFAPVGRQSICYSPRGASGNESSNGRLYNYYATMDGAPKERKLSRGSTPQYLMNTLDGFFMFWSGMAANGGEFLSDGGIYLTNRDKWVPITQFEAPTPRTDFTATAINYENVILIWGGRTAAGITAGGALYALP